MPCRGPFADAARVVDARLVAGGRADGLHHLGSQLSPRPNTCGNCVDDRHERPVGRWVRAIPRPCSASVPSDAAGRPIRGTAGWLPAGGSASPRSSASPASWRAAPRAADRVPERIGVGGRVALAGGAAGVAAGPPVSQSAKPPGPAVAVSSLQPSSNGDAASTAVQASLRGHFTTPSCGERRLYVNSLNACRRAPCAASSRPSWALRPSRPRPRVGGGWWRAWRLDRAHDHRGALCTAHALPGATHRPARPLRHHRPTPRPPTSHHRRLPCRVVRAAPDARHLG